MASAANPYAVQAAEQILRAGGHAVDAAIAAHAVLGLVEPQSSGLGGGGFMLVYRRDDGAVLAYDGRETAPAGARADMFVRGGESLPYLEAWQSGLAVGTPGMVALYARVHADHGRLDLATVLAPAIELARDGFVVSPRLADFLVRLRAYIRLDDNPTTAGNAVSLTASVESVFGSSRWAGGFLLNNQLTDFARDPGAGEPPANVAAPGKRPRSSMSPTLAFDVDGGLRMVSGSPGGNSIIAYVAKSLIGVLRWDLSAQQAIELPNVVARGREVRVETDVAGGESVAGLLEAQGFPVEEREGENSGLRVIVVTARGLQGGADPRREGTVVAIPP